jgi:serine/threonine-protein phosphatase 2B catalytic subunit
VSEAEAKRMIIRNKIKAVGKLAVVFNTLRTEKESINELKAVLGVQKLPPGSLALGAEGIKDGINWFYAAIKTFDEARLADLDNERLPPTKDGNRTQAAAMAPKFNSSTPSPQKRNPLK